MDLDKDALLHRIRLLEQQNKQKDDLFNEMDENHQRDLDQLMQENRDLRVQLKRYQEELTCRQLNRSVLVEQPEPMIVEQPVTEENPVLDESRTNEIYELQDKLADSVEEKNQLQKVLKDVTENLQVAEAKIEQVKDELKLSNERVEDLVKECNDLRRQNKHYSETITDLQATVEQLQAVPLEAKSQGNSIFAELDTIRRNAEDVAVKAKWKALLLEKENASLKETIEKLSINTVALCDQTEVELQQSLNKDLLNQKARVDAENIRLLEEVQELKDMIQNFDTDGLKLSLEEALRRQLKLREEEVERLRIVLNQREKAIMDNHNLLKQIPELQRERVKMEQQISLLEHEIAKLKGKLKLEYNKENTVSGSPLPPSISASKPSLQTSQVERAKVVSAVPQDNPYLAKLKKKRQTPMK
ncbi:hypothetical protein FO519_000352 [Halicephalobus sp. NKZ332]|nr:hypothetical protein FO519_000352 [Halicephalobus sp. NKZ332]